MKTVAIIGASNDRNRFGNKAVRAFKQQGYTVFPVNPTETEVEGLTAYRTILDLPERPDLVSVYVAPPRLLKLLPDVAEKGCDEIWLNPGTDSAEVSQKVKELGLRAVRCCSILAIGVSPSTL